MKHSRSTPKNIQRLQRNEIFVFGSDLYGNHIRGAAELARKQFGAIQGQKVGIQGNSYAIPVSFDAIQDIKPYVDDFIIYAQQHSYMKFMVIRIGCGMAGFTPSQIAPLFYKAMDINNIYLPKVFWDELLE
ncbi:MAG: hypothetical protein J1E04_00875 [Alistipes sp.]|nr:hypothetical protein [Alistipes sp.]